MDALKPYSDKSKCHACGSGNVTRTFCRVTNASGEDQSRIDRQCISCGYTWRELPLYLCEARVDSIGAEVNERLRSLIIQAIGQASLCWENPDSAGKFQANEATEVVKSLLYNIQQILADLLG